MTAEDRRQAVHAAMTLWIVALRWTGTTGALVLAGAAVLVNWVALPLLGWDRGMRRADGPWVDGVKLYPVAVLVAVLVFPLPVAAAGWAVMGLADAASNVVGRRFGTPPFLGRPDRSLAGTCAFLLVGAPAALAAHSWVTGAAPTAATAQGAAAAAVAGALAELLVPRGWDDNVVVCLAAAAAFAALAA